MIQRNPNYPEPPHAPRRGPSLKVWVPVALAAALIVGTFMLVVLPQLWNILFPVELDHRTGTLRLLRDLDVALADFRRRHPDVPLESFFIPDEVNAGAKVLYRCLHTGGTLDEEALRREGRIVTDRDGHAMFVDPWKNPVVFVPRSAAGRTFTCRNAAGDAYALHAPTDFGERPWLLWSIGADGVNQDRGAGDLAMPAERAGAKP